MEFINPDTNYLVTGEGVVNGEACTVFVLKRQRDEAKLVLNNFKKEADYDDLAFSISSIDLDGLVKFLTVPEKTIFFGVSIVNDQDEELFFRYFECQHAALLFYQSLQGKVSGGLKTELSIGYLEEEFDSEEESEEEEEEEVDWKIIFEDEDGNECDFNIN